MKHAFSCNVFFNLEHLQNDVFFWFTQSCVSNLFVKRKLLASVCVSIAPAVYL